MSKVQDYARQKMLDWPTLYKSYSSVLLSIFSYGSGHEWQNGEIVCRFEESPTDNFKTTKEAYDHRVHEEWCDRARTVRYGSDESKSRAYCPMTLRDHEMYWKLAEDRASEVRFVHEQVETLLEDLEVPEYMMPFNSEYCLIANLPDDIHEDWLDAAELVADMLADSTKSVFISQYETVRDPEVPALSKETWMMLQNMLDDSSGKPRKSFEEAVAAREKKKQDDYAHDKTVVAKNREIGQEALQRIKQIRVARSL